MKIPFISMQILSIACLSSPIAAATFFVSLSGNDSDGHSWTDSFTTIEAGIVHSASGDQVWVSEGSYPEVLHIPDGVSLYGGFPSTGTPESLEDRNPSQFVSLINPSNQHPGVEPTRSILHPGDRTRIDGFKIAKETEGVSLTIRGVYCEDVTCTLANCWFEGNGQIFGAAEVLSDATGGAIAAVSSTLKIERCQFIFNGLFGRKSCSGGAIYCKSSSVEIISTIFAHNRITLENSSETCQLWGNGAALHFADGSNAYLENCLFDDNHWYFLAWGDYCAHLSNGSAIYNRGSDVLAVHCTFFDRPTSDWVNTGSSGETTLINCILWKERLWASELFGGFGWVPPEIQYSNVKGGFEGKGNIDADPQYENPEEGIFDLLPSSSCIDSATPAGVSTDLFGNPRPSDRVGVGFEGPHAFDMGFHEFQFRKTDFNQDGVTDGKDLFLFNNQWMDAP